MDYCSEPKQCPQCGEDCYKKYIHVASIECRKCHKQMKLAAFRSGNSWNGARDFSEKDCAAAKERGAIVNQVHSKTAGKTYLASCCCHCGEFSGDFFLHDYFYDLEKQENNKVFTGYYCIDCERHFE